MRRIACSSRKESKRSRSRVALRPKGNANAQARRPTGDLSQRWLRGETGFHGMGPEAPAVSRNPEEVRKKKTSPKADFHRMGSVGPGCPEEVRKNQTSPKADFHKMGSVGPGRPEVARKNKTSPRADFHKMGSAVPEKMKRENPV